MTTDPFRTVKIETDPRLLRQWQVSRRLGDKRDERAELLRRVALRPSDPVSSEQRAAFLAAGVGNTDQLITRASLSESGQLDLARAAAAARERLHDAVDERGDGPARTVLTGNSETTPIVPDSVSRQLFGTTARMPVGPAVAAQLGSESAA